MAGCVAIAFFAQATISRAEPTCNGVRGAKAQFELGRAHIKLGAYEQAIADFEAGYRCVPLPLFLYNIAQVARQSGQRGKALEYYRRYLAAEPGARDRVWVKRQIAHLARAHGDEPPPSASMPPAPELIAPTAATIVPSTMPPAASLPSTMPPAASPPSASATTASTMAAVDLTQPATPPPKPAHRGRWIALGVVLGVVVVGGAITAGVLLSDHGPGTPSGFHNLGSFDAAVGR